MVEELVQHYEPRNRFAQNLAYGLWALAVLVVLGYMVKLAVTSDPKTKYDFINRHEISLLWLASIILILGCCFYANSNITELSALWVLVRVFITVSMGLIAALIIQNLLKFYYPFFIENASRRFVIARAYRPKRVNR